MFAGIRDLPREEIMAKMQELRAKREQLRKDAQEKAQAVLTDAQKAKIKEMKGAEFKLERPAFPGRGGAGGAKPAPKT